MGDVENLIELLNELVEEEPLDRDECCIFCGMPRTDYFMDPAQDHNDYCLITRIEEELKKWKKD